MLRLLVTGLLLLGFASMGHAADDPGASRSSNAGMPCTLTIGVDGDGRYWVETSNNDQAGAESIRAALQDYAEAHSGGLFQGSWGMLLGNEAWMAAVHGYFGDSLSSSNRPTGVQSNSGYDANFRKQTRSAQSAYKADDSPELETTTDEETDLDVLMRRIRELIADFIGDQRHGDP